MPADKPFITLSGTMASNTIITWGDTGKIHDSATLSILASDFVGRYLVIQVYAKPLFTGGGRPGVIYFLCMIIDSN